MCVAEASCVSLQHQHNLYTADKILFSRQLRAGLLINPQVKRAEMRCVGQGRSWLVVVLRSALGYSDS